MTTLPECGNRCVVCTDSAPRPALVPRDDAAWRHVPSGYSLCAWDALCFLTWEADGQPEPEEHPIFAALVALDP